MTFKEFTERTGVEVELDEFYAIHRVYEASDLEKDDFCALWKKMNKTRVDEAAKERKIAKQNEIDLTKSKPKKTTVYIYSHYIGRGGKPACKRIKRTVYY